MREALPLALAAIMPRSIVARTTLAIISLALLVGALFTVGAATMLQRKEHARLETQLNELLATVESAVSIACFVKDEALAREIVSGLLRNDAVAGVRITADGATLYELSPGPGGSAADTEVLSIRRVVHSPFAPDAPVGEIKLSASRSRLQALAWGYARYVVYALSFELALIALAIAWVVYGLITRPVRSISDELHRMEVRTGMRLHVPPRNERDEIGRLVADVNALIAKLTSVLDSERRLRLEREAGERRLATIFEKVNAGIFEVDRNGLLRSCNPAFTDTLGVPPEPPRLQTLLPAHEQALMALIKECLDSGEGRQADFKLSPKHGRMQWVEIVLTPVDGQRLQGVVNDITERKHVEIAAQQMAARDTLTGLLNRRGLEAGLGALLERRAREPGLALTVVQVDLDYFKQVNDTHGHHAGDVVLRRVGEILDRAVRRTDLVARTGGDEFTVVLVGADSPAKAQNIANGIVREVGKPIDIGGGAQARIGASIGIAAVAAGESMEPAVKRADEAMYAAKQAGRNRVCLAPAPAAENPPIAA